MHSSRSMPTITIAAFALLLLAVPAQATNLGETVNVGLNYGTATGLGTRDIREVIMAIINVILSFLSIVAIILILTGGFKWMVAGGNDEKVDEAKKTLTSGIVGLVVIFTSYAIASFVVRSLTNVTM